MKVIPAGIKTRGALHMWRDREEIPVSSVYHYKDVNSKKNFERFMYDNLKVPCLMAIQENTGASLS